MVQLGLRARKRQKLVSPTLYIGSDITKVDGNPPHAFPYYVNYYGSAPYDFTLLEKCWDELHTREKVIQYYLKKPGQRKRVLTEAQRIAYETIFRSRGMHPADLYARLVPSKVWTSGGPFTLTKSNRLDEYVVKGIGSHSFRSGVVTYSYVGGFLPNNWSPWAGSSVDLHYYHNNDLDRFKPATIQLGLEAIGAKAWNRSRPKTSGFDTGTFLGELRELPQMLKTTAKGFYDAWRAMGGPRTVLRHGRPSAPSIFVHGPEFAKHFLNHNFGWVPFIKDLLGFYKEFQNLDRGITQMLRDNGQWIKREFRVEETENISEYKDWSLERGSPLCYPIPQTYVLRNSTNWGKTITYKEEYSHTWFEGRFRYYIPRPPDNPDTRTYNRMLDTLRRFGVNVNPSVIWNLTPWSWLIDWFSNAGDVIENANAQNLDNLTAKYAYIMRHKRSRYVNNSTVYFKDGDVSMSWAREVETKCRIEANPFGFGLSGGGLSSNYRIAILAALGLTRR